MKLTGTWILASLLTASMARAQSISEQLPVLLSPTPLQAPQVVTYELQEFLLKRAAQLPAPTSAQQWTTEAERIRQHMVQDVIFHGWPTEWVNSPPKFEEVGTVASGKGYRLRKFRYEVVPGYYSTALLYEPEKMQGRAPAVLDTMGHFSAGKAMEFEQQFCINQALRGMIALNIEWLGMGEIENEGNSHWYGADLDLTGANAVGLFYLSMRRGLDYLSQDANVDPSRIAVTGLSSGGWQSIVLGALDTRVKVSIPVAGYGNMMERIGRQTFAPSEPGDLEQEPTDFLAGQDYSTLTAMRAPRPTLIISNAEDSCCYRAPLVKPYIYDAIKPFFKLYGKQDALQFYDNTDILAHNYDLTNRLQAYRFLSESFGLSTIQNEIPVGKDIKSYDELAAGVPKDNLTLLTLARKMGSEITRSPIPSAAAGKDAWAKSARAQLQKVLRYEPVIMEPAWLEDDTHHNGVESISYRFHFSNGLSATGVWLKELPTPDGAPLTIVLNDKGRDAAAAQVSDHLPVIGNRLDRGEQVLVVNLVFTGDSAPDVPVWSLDDMLRSNGERSLGMEVAQLLALVHWAKQELKAPLVRVETGGIRSQVESLVSAAMEPNLLSEVVTHAGMHSLGYLLDKPVEYRDAPDLFCLDLYKDFDLDRISALAEPTAVTQKEYLELPAKP